MTEQDHALANLAAQVDAHFPGRRFNFSTGRDMGGSFQAETVPAGELVRRIASVEIGEKGEGPLWSPFKWRDGRRLAALAEFADLLVLDSDRGETLFAIEDALRAAGLAGLVVPSSSHGKRSTSLKASELEHWRAAIKELEGDEADMRVARMLEMEGKLVPAIARTAREGGRRREIQTYRNARGSEQREVEFVDIAHDPVPKFRIVLFLAQRWSASDYPSAGEAMRAWEDAHQATTDRLGLALDESVGDTGRLFFETRVQPVLLDTARRARLFVPGAALDLSTLPAPRPRSRVRPLRKRPGRPAAGGAVSEFDGMWTRPDGTKLDLRDWAAGARDFKIVDALMDPSNPDRNPIELDERGERDGKLHIRCPFEDEHGTERDGGTFVMNQGTGRAQGFVVSCQHHACRGRDRTEYVARMLDDRTLLEPDLNDRRFRPIEFEPVEVEATTPATSTSDRPASPAGVGPFAGVEPLDLFAGDGLAGKPDLPTGLLPSVIEDFARDVAGRGGVEAGMPAAACLAAIAGALHDGFVIQPQQLDTEYTQSARLWITVVADPGVGKSHAIEPPTLQLRAIESRWAKEDARTRAAYEAAVETHKKRRTDAAADPRPSDDAWTEPPSEPESRRIVVDDLTTEALAGILATNPRGVLSLPNELTGWLGSFDAYRGTRGQGKDRSLWLRAFDGGPLTIDRATRRSLQVENWGVSILGGIQPDRLRRLAAKGELDADGLLQRFLTVWGRRVGTPVDQKPSEAAARNWQNLLESIAAARPSDFGRVVLSPAASEVFRSVQDLSVDLCALPSTSSAFQGHLSKWRGLYARLLLVIHAAESFDIDGRMLDRVDVDTARRTRDLLVRWLLPHSAALYREVIGTSGGAKHAEWIAGFILAHRKDTVSARDLMRAYRDLGDDEDAARRAMRPLEGAGWAIADERNNGKPPKAWAINPHVHAIFDERAQQEKARREAERQKLREIQERIAALSEPV